MKKHNILKMATVILFSALLPGLAACDSKDAVLYDDTAFEGSGVVGIPDLLDSVGYDAKKTEYDEDGSVAFARAVNRPLRHSRTDSGFRADITLERKDGAFDIMTSSWNTGALSIKTESTRYRIFVVGVDSESSYLIVSGLQKQTYGNNYDYFERRYPVPLKNYCTGAPLELEVVYYNNAYYITMQGEAQRVFKKIDSDTAFVETPKFSSRMDEFFESGERVLGLESLDVPIRFSDIAFSLGDETAKASVTEETHEVVIQNKNEDLGSVAAAGTEFPKGEPVVIEIAPKEGCYLETFTVNGLDCKGAIELNEEGTYQYTVIGIQSDQSVNAVFASGQEKKYPVTGSFAYTSGEYDQEKNSCKNEGDVVSVQAGMYKGTVQPDGRFEIELPEGVFKLQLRSEKFPAATTQVVVTDSPVEVGEIRFKRLNFTTNVSYNADDTLTLSANQSTYLFDEKAFEGSWVVHYTVQGASGGWFNTGGLYVRNSDGSFDYMFIYSQNGRAEVVMIESDQRQDNGPVYKTTHEYANCLKPIDVTIAYYQGAYHIMLDNAYACAIDASTALLTEQGTLTKEFFEEKPRVLGIRNYDSAATFSNISYETGDDAAWRVIQAEEVNVKAAAGNGGSISLSSNGKELPQDSVQSLGTNVSCNIVSEEGSYVDTFKINGQDSQYMLTGPFKKDGKNVYQCNLKAEKSGLNIEAVFTKAAPALHTVSGAYSYAEGLAQGEIRVSSGSYTGAAQKGKFRIALPKGTHIITFEDSNGIYATKKVVVEGHRISDLEVVMRDIDYQNTAGVAMTEEGFSVSPRGGFNYAYLPDDITAAGAFAAIYTVTGQKSGWYDGGGLFFQKNGICYTIYVKSINGKAVIMLQQPNVGNTYGTANYATNYAYRGSQEELKVTVIYYNETLYIRLGDGKYYTFKTPADMSEFAGEIDSTFFACGYRKLGFAALDSKATFTNVAYILGDERVKALFSDVIHD